MVSLFVEFVVIPYVASQAADSVIADNILSRSCLRCDHFDNRTFFHVSVIYLASLGEILGNSFNRDCMVSNFCPGLWNVQ